MKGLVTSDLPNVVNCQPSPSRCELDQVVCGAGGHGAWDSGAERTCCIGR